MPPTTQAPTTTEAPDPLANCGDKGLNQSSPDDPCTALLQDQLNIMGCEAGPADSNFGAGTDWAVRKFQLQNGLHIDGQAGNQVFDKLAAGDAAPCLPGENDEYDRVLCESAGELCILVHQVGGINTGELFDANGAMVDSFLVNTGKPGVRTRNTITGSLGAETFPTEASEQQTNAAPGVSTKSWAPGVRQIHDSEVGLMGDPHRIDGNGGNGGQQFHWRVAYSGEHDENGKSVPELDGNGMALENAEYDGGYWSHGCVHTPGEKLNHYDDTYYQPGIKVIILDQPTD